MVFYAFAYNHGLIENLFTPLVGYYTLFNVIISSIQSFLMSVENAPIVSTVGGLLVQMIPFIIILNSESKYFDTKLKKLMVSLSILLITPNEIWVNTTNSHFHFGLITFLILVSDTPYRPFIRRVKYLSLLVGYLTGPMSSFFAPLFVIKYITNRTKENLFQMLVSVFAGTLQVAITVYCLLYNNNYNRMLERNAIVSLKAYIGDNFGLLLPFGENDRFIIGLFIMPISFMVFWRVVKLRQSYDYFALAAFFIISLLSLLGSLNMAGGPRYGFVPTVIFICILCNFFEKVQHIAVYRAIGRSFATCFIIIQLIGFKMTSHKFYEPSFPRWKYEVKKWRSDPTYKMKIHPYNENKNWVVNLVVRE